MQRMKLRRTKYEFHHSQNLYTIADIKKSKYEQEINAEEDDIATLSMMTDNPNMKIETKELQMETTFILISIIKIKLSFD